MVPVDTLKTLEDGRGMELSIDKTSKHKGLNWDILRAKVKKGIRNATLMAVAPNANIGLLVGTTPGFDPRFAQVFSRNKISGKYMDVNHNLVKDLKNMGIWDKVKDAIIEYQGDISEIAIIPDHLKAIYKTSFTTSPYGYIEVAARAQKWVDQALSRNMYLETRDIDETMQIYSTAWKKGLKSTYYLHLKPRHSAEQSTVKVDKSSKFAKKAFGAFASVRTELPVEEVAIKSPIEVSIPEPVAVPLSKMTDYTISVPEVLEEISLPKPFLGITPEPAANLFGRDGRDGHLSRKEEEKKFKIVRSANYPSDPADALQCDSCQ
jgi:ribonucleoside-diphosphate reductase alpha chain